MNVITRRDIFEGKGYLPITLLQFSRGCSHKCSFCASSVYFKAHHYCRPVEDVIKEIKMQKRKLLFFVDDNIVCDHDKAKELFRALIPLKVHWVSQGSMDMLNDDELMKLMVKSGCLGLVIGFESISPECISQMNKYTNKHGSGDMYKEEIKKLRKWGLQTFAAFNILMPYPNTQLYERLKQEGRLLYDGKWWLHGDYRFNYAALVPKNMSADELTEISFDCRRRFNSPWSIIKRAFEPRTNLRTPYRFLTYLIYNPLFRKEVYKKQGMRFGLKSEKE